MKALSLRQPWAELILNGSKTIETRTWNTKFRGEFLIHAAKAVDVDTCKRFGLDTSKLVTGAIVGRATIVDVRKYETEKDWRADEVKHCSNVPLGPKTRYGYVLRDVVRFKSPVPCKGKLSFFEAPL